MGHYLCDRKVNKYASTASRELLLDQITLGLPWIAVDVL